MVEKSVYDPKAHKEGGKANPGADKPLHAKDEGVAKAKAKPKKARTPKINKYGFLHVNGELAEHLGLQFGKDKGKDVPVSVELVENGFVVKLVKA